MSNPNEKLDAAVHEGMAAYVAGFEAQRAGRAYDTPARGLVREMWVHGWNAAVEVEFVLARERRSAGARTVTAAAAA